MIRARKGMSLVEVLVTIVLIGIISAMATVNYGKIFGDTHNKIAKENLTNVESTQIVNSRSKGAFLNANELNANDNNLEFTEGNASKDLISVYVSPDGESVGVATTGDGKSCYGLKLSFVDKSSNELTSIKKNLTTCTGSFANDLSEGN